mmetsp:Transcript_91649/g.182588  ORF Transcript_91649/g.182588 Transcript_91649/m.182588 type:complete len:213 (-) Transcript_91649:770-1408(-)
MHASAQSDDLTCLGATRWAIDMAGGMILPSARPWTQSTRKLSLLYDDSLWPTQWEAMGEPSSRCVQNSPFMNRSSSSIPESTFLPMGEFSGTSSLMTSRQSSKPTKPRSRQVEHTHLRAVRVEYSRPPTSVPSVWRLMGVCCALRRSLLRRRRSTGRPTASSHLTPCFAVDLPPSERRTTDLLRSKVAVISFFSGVIRVQPTRRRLGTTAPT